MFFQAVLIDGEHFQHSPCTDVSVAKFCDGGHNPVAAHSLLVMRQSFIISTSALSLLSVVTLVAGQLL
jgi:hypothetical protein